MAVNTPLIFIKGIDKILKTDLNKHQTLLTRCKLELGAYRKAVSHEVKKKRYYKSLLGGGKFDDNALQKSMDIIVINIRHMSDKVKIAQDCVNHHSLIVNTLTLQLDNYYSVKKDRDYATKH